MEKRKNHQINNRIRKRLFNKNMLLNKLISIKLLKLRIHNRITFINQDIINHNRIELVECLIKKLKIYMNKEKINC